MSHRVGRRSRKRRIRDSISTHSILLLLLLLLFRFIELYDPPPPSSHTHTQTQWVRHKNATAVLYFVTHSILAVVLVVLRPARAQNYFTMTALEGELDGLVNRAGRGAGESP